MSLMSSWNWKDVLGLHLTDSTFQKTDHLGAKCYLQLSLQYQSYNQCVAYNFKIDQVWLIIANSSLSLSSSESKSELLFGSPYSMFMNVCIYCHLLSVRLLWTFRCNSVAYQFIFISPGRIQMKNPLIIRFRIFLAWKHVTVLRMGDFALSFYLIHLSWIISFFHHDFHQHVTLISCNF